MNKYKLFGFLIIAMFTLAACSAFPGSGDEMMQDESMSSADEVMAGDTMADDSHSEDMMDESSSGDAMDDDSHEGDMMDSDDEMDKSSSEDTMMDDAKVDTPAWFDHEFSDARTGQTFSINGFKGNVILVETMAMWCSNCLRQQNQVKELHDLVGDREDFISFGLDIDPNENISVLSGYVEQNGFDWLYSVSPTEVSREIDQLYGSQFLNPPSTPILIVDRDGQAHPLPFGIKTAAELYDFVMPFLDEGM